MSVVSLEYIQDLLSQALQDDLEHGVKVYNEMAVALFKKNYPALWEAIGEINAMGEDE